MDRRQFLSYLSDDARASPLVAICRTARRDPGLLLARAVRTRPLRYSLGPPLFSLSHRRVCSALARPGRAAALGPIRLLRHAGLRGPFDAALLSARAGGDPREQLVRTTEPALLSRAAAHRACAPGRRVHLLATAAPGRQSRGGGDRRDRISARSVFRFADTALERN